MNQLHHHSTVLPRCNRFFLSAFLLTMGLSANLHAELRVGDPGVSYDYSKYDPRYPQMLEWQKAGVEGGIPFLNETPVRKTISATDSDGINAAINEAAAGGGGQVVLRNGTYSVNKSIKMKSNVRLVGESKTGVKLIVSLNSGNAISFGNVTKAGLDNLSIEGGYGVPNDFEMITAKKSFYSVAVNMDSETKNSWLDNVNIINSGRHPLNVSGDHNTIRGIFIERAWNKAGGWEGYFQVSGTYNLVYDNTIKKIRHFAIQNAGARYNVAFKNNLEQDVNFHNSDDGDNLVEGNHTVLPKGLGSGWNCMMGPWASFHSVSKRDNYIYKNQCTENNNGGRAPYSDSKVVYIGPKRKQGSQSAFDTTTTNTPLGGTFYPVILTDDSKSSSSSKSSIANSSAKSSTKSQSVSSASTPKSSTQSNSKSSTPTQVSLNIQAESYISVGGSYNDGQAKKVSTYSVNGVTALNFINRDDYIDFSVSVPTAGSYNLNYSIATAITSGAAIEFSVGNVSQGQTNVNGSNWDSFSNLPASHKVNLTAGVNNVRIKASGSNDWQWNLDAFSLTLTGGAVASKATSNKTSNSSATSISTTGCSGSVQIGDGGWVFDSAKNDSRFPKMQEWAKAGVRGGIPCKTNIVETVSAGGNIQNAIDNAAKKGGGIVFLKSGTYTIDNQINLKSNVVLRGESRSNTRLLVAMRQSWQGYSSKKYAILLNGGKNAGIENLTMFYSVPGYEPIDFMWDNDFKKKKIGDNKNTKVTDKNLYVGFIQMKNSQDSWVQNTNLLESGTDPISTDSGSSYLSFRGNLIDRCYNKGGSGSCYIDIRGNHNLLTENRISRIRHLALQGGADLNVVYNNDIEVDVNFHSGDDGDNLIERNRIKLPYGHQWSNLSTGGAQYGHKPPGPNNLLYKNDSSHGKSGKLNIPDANALYKVTGYGSVSKQSTTPSGGTLYAVKRN